MADKPSETVVWTRAYRPFILGGNCDRKVKTIVEYDLVIKLRMNKTTHPTITLFRITSPDGKVYYVEQKTRGLMGDNLNQITNEYCDGDPAVLEKQLAEMSDEGADHVDEDTFWEMLQ